MKLNARRKTDDSDIDITPMLDVVFIMLIFFIVTASFVKENGIGLYSPSTNEPRENSNPLITVMVSSQNKILVQEREVDSRALRPTILRLRAENPDAQVNVIVEPQALTRYVVLAVDGIRAANVNLPSISLAKI
jgi:biopolymer transport protein ExbD